MLFENRLRRNPKEASHYASLLKTWAKSFGNGKVKALDRGYMTNQHRKSIKLSAMERWKNGLFERSIKERRQFDNQKPEELTSEFDNSDVDNSYLTSLFKGRNFVGLDFVYKLLDGCKACKTTLSLTRCQRERLIGLARILYLSCKNCYTITMVKTVTWYPSKITQDACEEIHVCSRYVCEVPTMILLASKVRLCVCFLATEFLFCF